MRIAIVDLGTNSVRFDVHEIISKNSVRLLHREKMMVRLGQGVFISGKLDKNAIHRTLHALIKFKKTADRLHVTKIIAFGTCALREAQDRDLLIKAVREQTGIEIRVISGSEEAKLIAEGVLAHEVLGKHKVALVDIGGGSTEISICHGKKILHFASFPLGVARLQQVFLKRSPPPPKELKKLRAHIREVLLKKISNEGWPKVGHVLGSSGTVRAIGRILKKTQKKNIIAIDDLKDLNDKMHSMTTTELLGVPGMESKRVDMILAGAILLEQCMVALKAKKARPTAFSLRDGILVERRALHPEHSPNILKQPMASLYDKAQSLGANLAHLKRSVRLAETLFQRLKHIHGLDTQWMVYLRAATILRDIGEAVSPASHEKHSFYIIKKSHLPTFQDWEIEFVARLCLHHESTKLKTKELDFAGSKEKRAAFVKLLALLRIVDSLDTGPEARLHLKQVRPKKKSVELLFSGRRLTGLENLNLQLRKKFFQKVFERSIEAVRA